MGGKSRIEWYIHTTNRKFALKESEMKEGERQREEERIFRKSFLKFSEEGREEEREKKKESQTTEKQVKKHRLSRSNRIHRPGNFALLLGSVARGTPEREASSPGVWDKVARSGTQPGSHFARKSFPATCAKITEMWDSPFVRRHT